MHVCIYTTVAQVVPKDRERRNPASVTPKSKRNQPIPRQNIPHLLLHPRKLNKPTTLTLQMIKHARQILKALSTAPLIRTMIDLLLMSITIDMLTQSSEPIPYTMADITFVAITVPGVLGYGEVPMPFEEVLGDEAVGVFGADEVVDGLAVDVGGVGAGSGFEVVGYTGCADEAAFAEGTGDGCALVDARLEVHFKVIGTVEALFARRTVVGPMPFSIHMLVTGLGADELSTASLAVPAVMSVVVHMVITLSLAPECHNAVVTFPSWLEVVHGIHMLNDCVFSCE